VEKFICGFWLYMLLVGIIMLSGPMEATAPRSCRKNLDTRALMANMSAGWVRVINSKISYVETGKSD
jgi:hypothetical protein